MENNESLALRVVNESLKLPVVKVNRSEFLVKVFGDKVEDIKVHNVKTDEGKTIAVDGVFIAVGILPNTEKFKGLVALDEGGYIIAGEDCVTSTPGIFAAGDIRTKQLRQVVTAVADGANAVISAEKYCDI